MSSSGKPEKYRYTCCCLGESVRKAKEQDISLESTQKNPTLHVKSKYKSTIETDVVRKWRSFFFFFLSAPRL